MGLFKFLSRILGEDSEQKAVNETLGSVEDGYPLKPHGWSMPSYKGRYICDWCEDIESLKRQGELEKALVIAEGCMDAMVEASRRNSVNVMEYYVIQVAAIQEKMGDYRGELVTLNSWFANRFPYSREDFDVNLRKRLAQARKIHAVANMGDDYKHLVEWLSLVEREKELKAQDSGIHIRTGYSLMHPEVSCREINSARFEERSTSNNLAQSSRPKKSTKSKKVKSTVKYSEVPKSFVAVDFETANSNHLSACAVALVKVRDGEIVDRYASYINPPPCCDSFENADIHGITSQQVNMAPFWNEIAPEVERFISGLPVYAHNVEFDRSVWKKLDSFFGTHTVAKDFRCSMRSAKCLCPGLENYKLPTVTKKLVPDYRLSHHDMESDAEACARIVIALRKLADLE